MVERVDFSSDEEYGHALQEEEALSNAEGEAQAAEEEGARLQYEREQNCPYKHERTSDTEKYIFCIDCKKILERL